MHQRTRSLSNQAIRRGHVRLTQASFQALPCGALLPLGALLRLIQQSGHLLTGSFQHLFGGLRSLNLGPGQQCLHFGLGASGLLCELLALRLGLSPPFVSVAQARCDLIPSTLHRPQQRSVKEPGEHRQQHKEID